MTEKSPAMLRAIGLMSGTSMDGVDAAILESDGERLGAAGATLFLPLAAEERAALNAAVDAAPGLADRTARPPAVAHAERIVDDVHARAVRDLLSLAGLGPADIDVIGYHGQTIFHAPERHLTIQIGDGGRLAAACGIDVVWDFRARDMELGGHGAPMACAYHMALARHAGVELPAVIVNLGGVGNVTWIGADGTVLAFDTGPANGLLDDLMAERTGKAMDAGGEMAASGKVDRTVLETLLADAYFDLPPPKSLDRKSFSAAPVAPLALEDAAATLTEFTAICLARAERHMPEAPRCWILSGGGTHNRFLLARIRTHVDAEIRLMHELGWKDDFVEAQAFAFLAVRSLRGLPLSFPGTTGVREAASGGRLSRAAPGSAVSAG